MLAWLLAVSAGVALGGWLQGDRPSQHTAEPSRSAASQSPLPIDPRMPFQLRVARVTLGERASGTSISQALISVNGDPARPFALGALVRDGLYVREITADHVRVANDDGTLIFDLAVDDRAPSARPAEDAVDPVALQIRRQTGAGR